jgi:hypothetical protein
VNAPKSFAGALFDRFRGRRRSWGSSAGAIEPLLPLSRRFQPAALRLHSLSGTESGNGFSRGDSYLRQAFQGSPHMAAHFRVRLAAALASAFLAAALLAEGTRAADPQLTKGIVVSATGNSLVIKDMAGKQQSFMTDAATKITVNGKPGKLDDLQETMRVQVTTDEKGKVLAVSTIDTDKHNQ